VGFSIAVVSNLIDFGSTKVVGDVRRIRSNPFAIFKEPLSVPLKLLNLYVMPKQIFYKSPR